MNKDDIRRVLIDTLAQIAPEGDFADLKADRPLRDQLDIDSYDFLHWMIALNDRLGVAIPEVDYPKLSTLNAATEYVAAAADPSDLSHT